MEITFDPAKRDATKETRGLDFADVVLVFDGATLTVEDTRQNYGERRFQTVGFLADRMVMVIWTPRGNARHIISMRKCNDREQARYQERLDQGG